MILAIFPEEKDAKDAVVPEQMIILRIQMIKCFCGK